MEGLEPPCLAALDPKSSASTNFATSACYSKLVVQRYVVIFKRQYLRRIFFANFGIKEIKQS